MSNSAQNMIPTGRGNLFAYVQITRPGNVVITALSVLVAGAISHREWVTQLTNLSIAALSAAVIAAGGNAFNDYMDRGLDRLQKPYRPLPAGRIAAPAALRWALFLLGLGVCTAAFLPVGCVVIAGGAAGLLLLYSAYGKSRPLTGNLLVAFIAALTFLYGGLAVGYWHLALWPAWLAFLFHLAREILKDMEDRAGDAAANVNTLPVRYGLYSARLAATIAFILLMISLPLPYYLKTFTTTYIVITLGGVLPLILIVLVLTWKWSYPRQLGWLSRLLKWDMLVGLIALYLGRP